MATSSSRNPCQFLDSPTTATHGPINTQPKIRVCNCCVSESSRDQLLKLMLDNIERINELFLNRHLYMTDESIARQQEAERRRKVRILMSIRDMQTAEQQTHMLRMLEKSFAREMDLEKKLTESRLIEEELKLRLLSSEQMFDKADVLSTEC
ncbi:hypothetical protein LWI29_033385 [Acer saccharum]|uniref:Uncharacterized protein n=1 Tax=Acer saccharum TaxID=4024 RepID=A0AA39VGK7_ACESA|nr:hypothetical protein LWI29_026451 [Acer saccharum]KAK0579907.1 hypothetical protein LWI29_033385 [Acer saccharum]KAK1557587.1 hypothetical protein Q3G72_027627 [Acer saccharum]